MTQAEKLEQAANIEYPLEDSYFWGANEGYTNGGMHVIDNPNQFGLFTEEQVKRLMDKARVDACRMHQNITELGNDKILSDFKQQNGINNE